MSFTLAQTGVKEPVTAAKLQQQERLIVLHSVDPRTGLTFGSPVAETSPEELDKIVLTAQSVFDDWAEAPAEQRARALDSIADALEDAQADLVLIADQETGLGQGRLTGEIARTAGQLRLFASMLRAGQHSGVVVSPADPASGAPEVRRMLWPLGPVAVYSASNFPFAFSVAGGDTASALAAGCPVVVKAHEGHPRTSVRVTEIVRAALHRSGAPDGLLATVHGFETGRRLIVHPTIRAAGFTGSLAAGRALAALAAGRDEPIPFFGELGSINPVVVLPHAARRRTEQIARGFVESFCLGGGQFCTKPGLLFAPADAGLTAEIGAALGSVAPSIMLTEKIRAGFRRAVEDAAWQSLPLLGAGEHGNDHEVTAEVRIADVATFLRSSTTLVEERFGPCSLVVTYDSADELRQALTALPGTLTASIHAEPNDSADVGWVAATLRKIAGRLVMNGWPTGVAVNHAMHHGGPWPASTNSAHTSVGASAVYRWMRPVAYQNWPTDLLPTELRNHDDQLPLAEPR